MVYLAVWISVLLFKCLMYKGDRDVIPGTKWALGDTVASVG